VAATRSMVPRDVSVTPLMASKRHSAPRHEKQNTRKERLIQFQY
jgi:hypothetical protein